ncbi:MAG: aminotransferase class I/II-fold pyridoxal phosphate-dependent enzyme, partial [Ahrensia sp.]
APASSLIELAVRPHVLIMKSFGKFFGLAGVRLGFVMGDAEMVASIERQLGPWAVSGPALAIGAQAFADERWIAQTRQWLADQRHTLQNMLAGLDFEPVGATDLFVTVAHPRAAQIADTLAQSRILVRPFDYAPHWLRFGLPNDEGDMDRLHRALASAL